MIVGYFGLFDLGIGQALTKIISEKLSQNKINDIGKTTWTAILLMAGFGVIGGGILYNLSPVIAFSLFKKTPLLQEETTLAFQHLSLTIPIVTTSTCLRGLLESFQKFEHVNIIKIPMGISNFLSPMVVSLFTNDLSMIVLPLVVTRVIACNGYALFAYKTHPELKKTFTPNITITKELLCFGGWLTISNIIGPVLLYVSRVMVAIVISAEAVAFYAVPYEIVTKTLILPNMLRTVLFPAFSHDFKTNLKQVRKLYRTSIKLLLIILIPTALMVIFFSKTGLTIWLNPEFSKKSFMVANFLAVGIVFNSLGLIAQSTIQSYGRPDICAKIHIFELILCVPYTWLLTYQFNVNGAALAWMIRVIISALILLYIAQKYLNPTRETLYETT